MAKKAAKPLLVSDKKLAASSLAAPRFDRHLTTLYTCNILVALSSLLSSHFNDLAYQDSCTSPDARSIMLAEAATGIVILLVAVITATNGIVLLNNRHRLQWPDNILLPTTIFLTPIVALVLYFISNLWTGLCGIPF